MKRYLVAALVIIGVLVCGYVAMARGDKGMIEDGKKVSFDYTLTVNGEEVDSSQGRGPLEYVQGKGMIVPGLEKQMVGLKVGDKRALVVSPEEGYGIANADAFQEVPKNQLPDGIDLQVGKRLAAHTQDGGTLPVIVKEVREDSVILDFNHPLADKELHFDVTIVAVQQNK